MSRKLLTITVTAIMFFLMFTVVSAAEQGELIVNGGFEEDAGWTLPDNGQYVDEDEAYEGKRAIKISSKVNEFAYQTIPVKPGGEYTISFYARCDDDSESKSACFKLAYKRAQLLDDMLVWHDKPFEGKWEIGPEWKKITAKVIIPDNIIETDVLLRLLGGGTVYYDNVSIVGSIPDIEENKKMIIKTRGIIEPPASIIPAIPLEETINKDGSYPIIVNGGFEAGIKGWSISQECERVSKADNPKDVYRGDVAMKISKSGMFSQNVNLVGGEKYILSFYAKSNSNMVNTTVKLGEYTDSKSTKLSIKNWNLSNEWQKYRWDFVVDKQTTSADLTFSFDGGEDVFYDSIFLEGTAPDDIDEVYDELINGIYEGQNIENGDFENQNKNWVFSTSSGVVGKEEAYSGDYAILVSGEKEREFAGQIINLIGGKEYTFSVFARGEETTKAHLKLQFEGITRFLDEVYEKTYDIGSGWTKITDKIYIPDKAIKAHVLLKAVKGDKVYYDNVSFVGPVPDAKRIAQNQYDAIMSFRTGDRDWRVAKWFYKIRTEEYWVDMVVFNGNEVYVIVLNRTEEKQPVFLPVISQNGKVNLGECTINDPEAAKTNNGFMVRVESGTTATYRITPETYVDYTEINTFKDLDNYAWAADAIHKMYTAGVVNDKGEYIYKPELYITRGDFAMYLIKALGLENTTVAKENFEDIDADAEYAWAVKIGKELGILKGTGDNTYNPEAPVTREDLMVICARGMRTVKDMADGDVENLDAFSDKKLIADYAASHIAAMVREGIIYGNADGTINPKGFTTRAEAAIIMQRLTEWK